MQVYIFDIFAVVCIRIDNVHDIFVNMQVISGQRAAAMWTVKAKLWANQK